MSRKYFGTDGIRGKVGEFPICPEFMLKLGYAAGKVLGKSHHGKVVIGKDTRISGYMFESVLEAGMSAAGMDALLLGPMPTPAIAYLTRTFRADAGIVISASHNSYTDNGIKFFNSKGGKLPDDVELEIEKELENPNVEVVAPHKLGKAVRIDDAPGRYIEFCKRTFPGGMLLKGLKLVVDCANGATYHVSPKVFEELGAVVIPVNVKPDGLNINQDCGSTSPEGLQKAVLEHQADAGIALDGDGDRVMMVDHKGELVDGDELIYIIATDRHARNKLKGAVVGTLMTNLGLEHALKKLGIGLVRADVGDRYVMEKLLATGSILGGENSGHIICLDRTTTGDGTVSALQVLAVMIRTGSSLHDLKNGMEKYPQVLLNVKVKERIPLDSHTEIQQVLKQAESELQDAGRVLLRYSGTEPLIRVMVEGADSRQVKDQAETIAAAVAANLAS